MDGLSHHAEDGFRNPHIPQRYSPTREDYIRWLADYTASELNSKSKEDTPPSMVQPNYAAIYHPDPNVIQVTWVGHATFLIQVDGVNILTDPTFSRRASPVQFAGPERIVPPGIPIEKLPKIDLVLLSHNHYDHLDADTVENLGNDPFYLVPLGNGGWFTDRGIDNLSEMDWWQQISVLGLKVNFVPAQHFSGRGLFDYNRSLWGGYVVETSKGNLYFAGDTGYSPDFREIGQSYGPMKLSFLPIGAYLPRWKNYFVHVNPKESLLVHRDVKSQHSIAMHWGTFVNLSWEPISAPRIALEKHRDEMGLNDDDFAVYNIGETRIYK